MMKTSPLGTSCITPLGRLLGAPQRESARADGDAIEPRIAAVLRTFDRLVAAVDEFRIGRRASHLSVITQATADLLVDANRLEQHLKELR